ncbi:MAG: hypothetical protein C3F13_13280 [Anaerolineales bacterium]|nr:hypothetical protein [Anaerolineae bacterium]PWB51409.1 MAG: hypothetical protein C3F13_13280 [Anaerolineales bacterium]
MGVIKFILRLIGWLVTIIVQYAGSMLVIFLFSVIFAGVDTISRLGWLALLLMIWVGYMIGINLVGMVALRWVWKDTRQLGRLRLLGSAIGALIPLLILLPIGYSVPVGDAGTRFYDLVTNNWQPILAQASFFAGILGYYIPGLIKTSPVP